MICALIIAPANAATGASMKIGIIEYDPYPAKIGEYVDVTVKVENIGYSRADAVSIKIEPEYPFSLDLEKNAIEYIGILDPEDAVVHEYHLFVDENAKAGTGSVNIYYQTEEGDVWFKKTFDLKVGSDTFDSRGTIKLDNISTDPAVFMPGDSGTVSFTLTNTATTSSVTIDGKDYDTNARVQSGTLKGAEGIEVTSSEYEGSGIIGPGDEITLSYNVNVSNDARDGTYYLDFSMVGNSHDYNNNWRIPVKVDSASVKVIPSKPLTITNGEGVLEFDVANMHPNTLNSVSVKLESDDVQFSPEEYFIGSMDPDELFTVEIKAQSKSDQSSSPISIEVEYRNGVNEHITEVATREIELVHEDNGSNNSIVTTGVALVLLLGVPAVVLFKRKKQNN